MRFGGTPPARWTAVAVVGLALSGCGAREDDAGELSATVFAGIDAGACDDGPSWLSAADWTTVCGTVRASMPPGARLEVGPTIARQSGEIGFRYSSVATFTDVAGTVRTLTLDYAGAGWSGARPELSCVTLDRTVLFDADPAGS